MRGAPTGFWGKLDRERVEWHPLAAHCADVAACAEAILRRSLIRRRLATLAGLEDLAEGQVARLSALAALHDIGKFNLGFQRKADPDPRDTAGHVGEVLALFDPGRELAARLFAALPTADLQTWCGGDGQGAFELLTAAIGHHGRPVRWDDARPNASLWLPHGELDPFAGIAELARSARRWFPTAFGVDCALPENPEFQHGFAGLVMLADWLGSDRAVFPFAEDRSDRMPFARERARYAVETIGLDAAAARAGLGEGVPAFDRVSAFAPREAQAKTMSLPRPQRGGITVLESETGSGKTEAALGRFVQLLHAGLVDGMVFALPTRTAATQLHRRVVEAVMRAFPDEAGRPPVVLAVPGYLQVDEVMGRRVLPGFEVLWNDSAKERTRYRGWAAENPKRYLAGAIAVGTIDQVLLSSLRVGHAHLRATSLLRQLLVVDEVHASDAYMNRILEEVLRFHIGAGGHAFLMSATLGTHVRGRLERAALGAVAGPAPTLAHGLETPYPAIHHAGRREPPTIVRIDSPGLAKTVSVSLEAVADDSASVAMRALAAARAGARVIVLRNTVADAVATQEAIEAMTSTSDAPLLFRVKDVVTLHHARFSKPDRDRLDRAIEDRFGKEAISNCGVIAVATQTVQQSLDLDADVLFTDLAPMDVLLQRLGRVHRHPQRNPLRPRGFETPRAVVLLGEAPLEAAIRDSGEARGKHGVGTVYDDLVVLEATRRRIAKNGSLEIPAQNRELVEVTTHPQALDELVEVLGPIWQKHRTRTMGKLLAHTELAHLNLVDRTQRFGSYSFKEIGLEERIAARLGESDRRAVFAEPLPEGPFGAPVRELTIPGWLARDAPPDPELAPTEVEASSASGARVLRFTFGPQRFRYDRLGLRRADAGDATPTEDIADA